MPSHPERRSKLAGFTPRTRTNPAAQPAPEERSKPAAAPEPDPEPKPAPAPDQPEARTDLAPTMRSLLDSVSVSTAADLLGISEAALRVRISEERFPSLKADRLRVVPVAAFDAWLSDREAAAKAELDRMKTIRRELSKAPRVFGEEA